MLTLTRWCTYLHVLPYEDFQLQAIFHHMLVACKITKFHEINFKILSRILVTPKILSKIKGEENLQWCAWCGELASLEHILLSCEHTKKSHWVECTFSTEHFMDVDWIFGHKTHSYNCLIWICNFTLYKCHLHVCKGFSPDILTQMDYEFACYQSVFHY